MKVICKVLKWLFIFGLVLFGLIIFSDAEDQTKNTWAIVGFIAWLYWLLKDLIEKQNLEIHRRLEYMQSLIERSGQ